MIRNHEDRKKLPLSEQVKQIKWDIEALEGDDMRSITHAQMNNDKAQEAIELMEKILTPMVLHADNTSKILEERTQELTCLKLVLPILLKEQKTKKETV
jgi:hypothetical protein|tara:strand:- start:154 stop:450 length:297 start_codon:yes stop_codon:yes gene_type:complete